MSKLSRRERERLIREEEIIDAAEKIFAEYGYAKSSMNQIAKEAQFSKRTLYKYFENKIDLYLTVALRLYTEFLIRIESLDFKGKNGYEKIEELFIIYYQFYKENESIFRVIYDIGKIRQETDNPKLTKYLKIDEAIAKNLEELILLGQQDGSISKDLNAVLTTRSLMFLLIGFFNQLTITGDTYTKHINTDMDKFISYALNLLQSTLE